MDTSPEPSVEREIEIHNAVAKMSKTPKPSRTSSTPKKPPNPLPILGIIPSLIPTPTHLHIQFKPTTDLHRWKIDHPIISIMNIIGTNIPLGLREVALEEILGEDQHPTRTSIKGGMVVELERTLSNSTQLPKSSQRIYRKRGRRGGRGKKKEKKQLNQGIFNLTGVEFSDQEMEVLRQGLKFAPDKDIEKFELFIDVEKYIRKLNIKKHFAGQATHQSEGTSHTPFVHSGKNNSVFNLKKGTNHHIEVFKNMVQDEIRELQIQKRTSNKRIWEGIKRLEENKQIVVRPADKGGD